VCGQRHNSALHNQPAPATSRQRIDLMRLLSWNVNGLRAVLKRGFLDFFGESNADVLCLQETKAHPDQLNHLDWPAGYHHVWNSAVKPGYSGTAIFTREQPLKVTYGLGLEEHDQEGRVINAEFADFVLVNVYTPNSKRDLSRLAYRTQAWDVAFRKHLKKLERHKPVIFCGDLNCAHQEIDLARPKGNERNAGFTIEERTAFGELLRAGFIDTFREFETGGGHYSWWSQRPGVRAKNIGWRIDYFGISTALRPRLKSGFIWPHVMGSDHCPVGIELE
jgi:exodeoxyribonuclease III